MRSSPYRRVLVVLDGTDRGERPLAWVRHLAGPGGMLHLLIVEPPARSVRVDGRAVAFVDQLEDSARAAARAYLEPVASRLREDGLAVQTHVCVGDATRIVPAAVDELEADLLVLTSGAPPRAPSTLPIPILTSGPRCRRSA